MTDRYVVTTTPGLRGFGIIDRELYSFCALPTKEGDLLYLEWPLRESAQTWLNTCYRLWAEWESEPTANRQTAVPRDWRPHPAEPSPWDKGWRYYNA